MEKQADWGTRILALISVFFLMLSQFIWFMPLRSDAETAGDELVVRVQYYGEIGDKIREKARFSRSELEAMGASTWYYTNITRVGTVMSMAAYGPEVLTIIEAAGIDTGSIGNITFRTTDGYTRNFTVDKHLRAEKYYYPNLASCYERNEDGNALTPTEGAIDGKQPVPAILALEFGESKQPGVHAEDLEMSTSRTYRFCMGQSDLQEGRMTDPSDGGGDISSMESCHSIYGIDITLTGSPIKGLSLDLDDPDIKVGSMKRISATFSVDEAFDGAFSAEDLTWTSSDESIATVSPDGEVTIHGSGAVTITATAPDGTTAEIVINGIGEDDEASSETVEDDEETVIVENEEEPVIIETDEDDQSESDTEKRTDDMSEDKNSSDEEAAEEKTEPAGQVTINAREIILGDIVVEQASPQDELRARMAEDAEALDEAETYSREAAAGTAAGTGLLCGAGAIGRVIRYRKDFRPKH
ncbi:MAG: Ig-like domain-containing protein [Mogibacterium sp.]|nr:Ig-like domain-containing protein [Mogibacterium sp.]